MRRPALTALVAMVTLLTAAAPAAAAPSSLGVAKLAVGKSFGPEVEVAALGKAKLRAGKVLMPVAGGEVGTIARTEQGGGLALRAGSRTARLRSLKVTLSPARSFVTARIGGDQRTLLDLRVRRGPSPFNPLTGEVHLERAAAQLTTDARARLARSLGLKRMPGRLGRLSIDAAVPTAAPDRTEPPVLARPASAVDVTAASITWRARESWIDYLHAAGERGGTSVGEGAVAGPAETIPPSSQARVYEFSLPFAQGWREPATGTSALYFNGLVNFHKLTDPFNIDLDVRNPEAELNGADSRLIFRLDGRGNSSGEHRRAVAVDLDLAAVAPATTPNADGSTTWTWERIPARVPFGTDAWSLADFYQRGDEWGSATISLTVGG